MITKEYLQQELVKRIDGYKRGVETTTDNIIAEMKSILVLVDALPDYEKKYNEALERAKKFAIDDAYASQGVIAKLIFPELRESEDERTRKRTIAILKQQRDYWSYDGPINKFPPATPRKDLVDAIDVALSYLEKQKEQKPAEWSKEDKDYYDTIVRKLEIIGDDCGLSNNQIKFLREHCPLHCLEWGEEDERIMQTIIKEGDLKPSEIAWLKSLRPSWKPSEKQMNCLCAVVDAAIRKHNESVSGYKPARVLKSLYEDLQKL